MAEAARVASLQAVKELRTGLQRSAEKARESLLQAEATTRHTQDELQHKLNLWRRKREECRRERDLTRRAYDACMASGYRDEDGRYIPPNCSAEEARYLRAARQLAVTEDRVRTISHWMKQVEAAYARYSARARQLTAFIDRDLAAADVLLREKIARLEEYVGAPSVTDVAVPSPPSRTTGSSSEGRGAGGSRGQPLVPPLLYSDSSPETGSGVSSGEAHSGGASGEAASGIANIEDPLKAVKDAYGTDIPRARLAKLSWKDVTYLDFQAFARLCYSLRENEPERIAGFYVHSGHLRGRIFVCRGAEDRGLTEVHEFLHKASNYGPLSTYVGTEVTEGLTEHLTNKIARSHGLRDSRSEYGGNLAVAKGIEALVGEDVIREAYFGDSVSDVRKMADALDELCGEGTWSGLRAMCEDGDFDKAIGLLEERSGVSLR